jgi:hypothetical protein
LAVITLLLVIHHTGQTAHVIHHFQTPGETYTPGRLGQILEERYETLGTTVEGSGTKDVWGFLAHTKRPDMFPLFPYEETHEDDEALECSEHEKPDECERRSGCETDLLEVETL